MSQLKVNQVSAYSGNTITLGTSGNTITIPAGATILNNGTATNFGQTYNGAVNWTSTLVTSALTVSAGVGYFVNTSSAAITVTLPASPTVGQTIAFSDYNRTFATNNLTLNRNGNNFQGSASNPVYDTNGQSITITYADSTKGWIPTVDDDVTNKGTYSIDFLVVAGGGSGGGTAGGGGGAGGYRTSTQTATQGTVITITVGDGGASVSGETANGNVGSDSSISGSGLTTITSAGGGRGTYYGGSASENGGSGGGGGGGNAVDTGIGSNTGGSGNTPSTSPSQGNNGGTGEWNGSTNRVGGGGGGAGAVGGNGNPSTSVCGNGGNGTASSITGSSVTRAGGGGGSGNSGSPVTAGTGGTGGGGNGAIAPNNGTAGTANTGSGGGGGSNSTSNSGAGGKGVVILSVPTASYSSTTTGSPTVTTSGSNTILQFNGSGSYTA